MQYTPPTGEVSSPYVSTFDDTLPQRLLDLYIQNADPNGVSHWGREKLSWLLGCHPRSIPRARNLLIATGRIRVLAPHEALSRGYTARCAVVEVLALATGHRNFLNAGDHKKNNTCCYLESSSISTSRHRGVTEASPASLPSPPEPDVEEAIRLISSTASRNGKTVTEEDARQIVGGRHLLSHVQRILPHYRRQVIRGVTGGGWWRAALRNPESYGPDEARIEIERDREARKLATSTTARQPTGLVTATEERGKKLLSAMNSIERTEAIDWLVTIYVEDQRPDVVRLIGDPDLTWQTNRALHFAAGKHLQRIPTPLQMAG